MRVAHKILICVAVLAVLAIGQRGSDWPLDLGNLGPDLTTGIVADTSSSYGTVEGTDKYYPVALTDDTFMPTGGESSGTSWASNSSGLDEWCEIAFAAPTPVSTVVLYWAYNPFREDFMAPQEVHVQTSDDGLTYADAAIVYGIQGVFPGYSDSVNVATFAAVTTNRVRIFLPGGMGNVMYSGILWICEIEIFSLPAGINRPASFSMVPTSLGLSAESTTRGVRFSVNSAAQYRLNVYDMSGRNLWDFAGTQQSITWNPGNTPKGVHTVVLEQGTQKTASKFVITR